MKKNVLIIQRRMPKYRVPMFEALRERLGKEDVHLHVVYGTPTPAEALRGDEGVLPWGTQTSCRYLHVANLHLVWQSIPRHFLFDQDLIIIPHENSLLANYLMFQRRRLGRVKLAFWGHGANFQSPDPEGYRESFKAWTARKVDWWFAYTSLSVEKVVESGVHPSKITCLNNAADLASLAKWRAGFSEAERVAVRHELGMRGNRVGVFLGSLYREKRLDFLFAAADRLRERLPDFELLVVGDGPLQDEVKAFAAQRPWCHWVGACQEHDKVRYVLCGQVMLAPGLLGLTILDSFALGVPLVTTDCGIHSPEIAYLENGRNGIMTADDLTEYVGAVERVLTDVNLHKEMSVACISDARKYSLESMVDNFCNGIVQALDCEATKSGVPDSRHVAVIWQRFLPNHAARIRHLQERLSRLGHRLTAIEVASQDASYGFPPEEQSDGMKWRCCFPGEKYHDLKVSKIHSSVLATLNEVRPDLVFAPATPFPEGMAAISYRMTSGSIGFMTDDAWEHTDRKGWVTRQIKRLIHRNLDGVFIPAPSHLSYYLNLGFPQDRVLFGVYAVDNGYFSRGADSARDNAFNVRSAMNLPEKYFLFVGRLLPRKGVETLISAYQRYRNCSTRDPWSLVLVGGGSYRETLEKIAEGIPGIQFLGPRYGEDLCRCYGLAGALVVPSSLDQWGMVVNEGLASGLPVLVSRGCGAARTLVREGENGWTFAPEDDDALSELMLKVSTLPDEVLERMGEISRKIVADWSLDRFADGVVQALALPRREPAGMVADLLSKLWKGRVSIN